MKPIIVTNSKRSLASHSTVKAFMRNTAILSLCVLTFVSACGAGGGTEVVPTTVNQSNHETVSVLDTSKATFCAKNLVYEKDFDDNFSQVDENLYQFQYPWGKANPGAKDDSFYDKSALHASSDGLAIQAVPAALPLPQFHSKELHYQSGMLSTYPRYTPKYGYFEASIRVPADKGMWPAFWMLDSHGKSNEIDILEEYSGTPTVFQTVWYGNHTKKDTSLRVTDPASNFHKYGVLWEPDQLTFYVDGKQTASFPNDSHGTMYLMLSLQTGSKGAWFGQPIATELKPRQMFVRYLHGFHPTTSHC